MKHSFEQHCNVEEISSFRPNSIHEPFFIMHINIRSLQKNFTKLQELLSDISPSPDLIALSETWHDSSSFFRPCLSNYDFVSSSHSCNKAGGVAMFLKKQFSFFIRNDGWH